MAEMSWCGRMTIARTECPTVPQVFFWAIHSCSIGQARSNKDEERLIVWGGRCAVTWSQHDLVCFLPLHLNCPLVPVYVVCCDSGRDLSSAKSFSARWILPLPATAMAGQPSDCQATGEIGIVSWHHEEGDSLLKNPTLATGWREPLQSASHQPVRNWISSSCTILLDYRWNKAIPPKKSAKMLHFLSGRWRSLGQEVPGTHTLLNE